MKTMKIILSILAFTYSFAALGSKKVRLCKIEKVQEEYCVKVERQIEETDFSSECSGQNCVLGEIKMKSTCAERGVRVLWNILTARVYSGDSKEDVVQELDWSFWSDWSFKSKEEAIEEWERLYQREYCKMVN